MTHAIETIDLGEGLTANIFLDDMGRDMEPYTDDEGVRIVVLHRRYEDPAKGACGSTPEEVADWIKANKREWFVVPLWMYDHSGVIYRVGSHNPFHCPWDSGQVGILALKKSEWGHGKGERNAKRMEYAEGVIDEYSKWANGEVYGYTIMDEYGTVMDSCYGFIGDEYIREAIEEAAEPCRQEVREMRDLEIDEAARDMEESRPDMYEGIGA